MNNGDIVFGLKFNEIHVTPWFGLTKFEFGWYKAQKNSGEQKRYYSFRFYRVELKKIKIQQNQLKLFIIDL